MILNDISEITKNILFLYFKNIFYKYQATINAMNVYSTINKEVNKIIFINIKNESTEINN